MNGKERLQAQIASGVREIVEDIDYLRIKFGVNSIQVLTPRVETRLRSGYMAAIPLKLQFVYENQVLVILTYEMGYPRETSLNVELLNLHETTSVTNGNSSLPPISQFPFNSNARLSPLNSDIIALLLSHLQSKRQEKDVSGSFLRTAPLCDCMHDFLRPHQNTDHISHPQTISVSPSTHSSSAQATGVEDMNVTVDSASRYFTCGSCRQHLFQLSETETHVPPKPHTSSSSCTSYFLTEAPSWLVKQPDQVSGKIACPKCAAKLGHWSWSGLQCGCASWITPAFQIIKSKVDLKISSAESMSSTKVDSIVVNRNAVSGDQVLVTQDEVDIDTKCDDTSDADY